MAEVLTVCTGNICRSPLAAQLLGLHAARLRVTTGSAGVRARDGMAMTPEAQRLAERLGVAAADASAHESRFLTARHLTTPDLILTMTRDHRRAVAELAPSRLRSTFTAREFARLAAAVADDDLRAHADAAGADASARVRAAAVLIASHRGLVPPPDHPDDDDVIDPYRRSWETYERSGAQLAPAIEGTARVLAVVLG